jgi:hypothetical protein
MIVVQFRIILYKTTFVAIAFVAAVSLFAGTDNLDWYASAILLERFVSLIGIILITSVCFPEQDRRIREVVTAKTFSFRKIIVIRLILSSLICLAIIGALACLMLARGCVFPVREYIFGAFAIAFFIGALGFLIAGIFDHTIAGYFVSVIYFFMNMMSVPPDSVWYLFSLSGGNSASKPVLTVVAVMMICVTLLVRTVKARAKNGNGNLS